MFLSEPKSLFITPAFDAKEGIELAQIPQSKSELLELLNVPEEERKLRPKPFPSYILQNISKWATQDEIYNVTLSKGDYFEPYFVTHRSTMFYDEIFNGWGYDKLSQVESMQEAGHNFKMLPDTFMVHLNHGGLKAYTNWGTNFVRTKRYYLKDFSFRMLKLKFKGFLVNDYYPPWLIPVEMDECQVSMDPHKVREVRKKVNDAKATAQDLRRLLNILLVVLAVNVAFVAMSIRRW